MTFDSGGIQIKSDTGMHDMKMDMAGAASVIAAFWYLDQIESDIPLVGAVGLVENMTGGSAQKPLDIVRAHNKKTVEIHHTDAEGRLVLGDLVSYVGLTYKPDRICTIATLTGACIHALGFDYAGVSGTDVSYIQKIVQRSLSRPEKLWHLPLDARMRESVKSTIADVKNISSDMKAGSSLGAAFITAFLPQSDTLYVHFDIAGPAYRSKPWGIFPADGTGFGVMTLIDVAQDI